VTTLGGPSDAQDVDGITDLTEKRYVHHYNFPPFSVGEARPLRGPGRREIGHGALAEKALLPLIPPKEEFPYSLRVVSEALESNGSTSMASVCGSTLSLMDAGVPIIAPASGIAMGLVTRGDEYVILSDIQGTEDFSGDMDFKVAGTENGITAIQMDTKIHGLTMNMVRDTLFQAKEGRAFILAKMMERISEVRETMSAHAPRMFVVQIDPEKIGEIIGPGGKTIKKIQAETGAQIDIEQEGKVYITCADAAGGERARAMIEGMGTMPQIGAQFKGKVTRLMNFGAFVEFLPGKEGLIRVEDSGIEGVRNIAAVLSVGDEVLVSVSEIDSQGRINLTRRGLMDQQPEFTRADGTKPPTVAPEGSDVPPPRDSSGGPRRDGGRSGGRSPSRSGAGRFGGGGSISQEDEPVRATFRPKRR
jgi:polyribonucleotide nucleotidyltransferase